MSIIKYPESIYSLSDKFGDSITTDRSTNYGKFAEHGYRTGLEDGKKSAMAECLDGYSNLTEAIIHRVELDWSKLNGRKAKCVHPEEGTLSHKLKRNPNVMVRSFDGWYKYDGLTSHIWANALKDAWDNTKDWSLWIEGDIPLKLPTADKLKPGSVFVGKNGRITEPTKFVVAYSTYDGEEDITVAYPMGVIRGDCFYASGVDVIEVKSGGFHKNTENTEAGV